MDFPFCRLSIYSNKLHELWKEGKNSHKSDGNVTKSLSKVWNFIIFIGENSQGKI